MNDRQPPDTPRTTVGDPPKRSLIAGVIAWCIDHRFVVVVFALIAVAAGVIAMQRTPLDAIPDLSDAQVIIYSKWSGRDPQTIEDQVTYPVTTAMLAVPNVKVVRGYSFFGLSFVYVIFEDGTDLYWARSRVLEYLDQVKSRLPKDVDVSLGPDASGVGWVYQYTVEDKTRSYNLGELRAIQDWYVRYQLMSVPGVAEVASIGGFVRQYQITVDPYLLQTYNIPLTKISQAVRANNNDVGGRLLEIAESEYMVRGRGYFESIEDIENVVVKITDGTPVLLKDIADVQMGPDIRRGIAEKNGEGEVVGGIVVMRYGENALEVIENVKKKIAEVSRGLPDGVEIVTAYDRSGLIKRSIATLRHELLQQILIVVLACILFLWHARSAFVAAFSLPMGILLAFIIMYMFKINANIMSIGGIAIAIGAMVDASVVLVENTHKHLERSPGVRGRERWELIKAAAVEVGPSLFFSLLIITVSFLPVFALTGQAGRLFTPLAFTKTFAMAASAVIAITLIPVLIGFFVRGRIREERTLPISRALIGLYRPVIHWALRRRGLVITLAALVLVVTQLPASRLGSEFMPPLNEGDILYMPTSFPGISETEAKRVLQTQDKLFKTFPEVNIVFGKIGRAETATDPAPMTMVETTVSLHDHKQWPKRWIKHGFLFEHAKKVLKELNNNDVFDPGTPLDIEAAAADVERMSRKTAHERMRLLLVGGTKPQAVKDASADIVREALRKDLIEYLEVSARIHPARMIDLRSTVAAAVDDNVRFSSVPLRRLTMEELMYNDLEQSFRFIGMTNAWLMPIKVRIDMLSTGIKTPIGIKIFGDNLETLQQLAIDVEDVVRRIPGTLSAVGERVMGGNYIDFEIDRLEAARHGLSINDVQEVIETAVGGKNVTQTIEGRYRFPVNVRYPRELRDDPQKLGRVLVHTPLGEKIPMNQVADIFIRKGPPAIKSENGLLSAIVYVDLQKGQDVGSYVDRAKDIVESSVAMPPGYYLSWSGQYEYMLEVARRMRVVIPVTLIVIFLLLYFNFGRITETLIVMLSLPFALVGGIWCMTILGYNMSVASAIGFIALAGLAAEIGVVMLLFLNLAYRDEVERGGDGVRLGGDRLRHAIVEGAVMRVRPIIMTIGTTVLGLLPLMWAVGAGAGPMKRMAAPMIGGLVSAMLLTLVVIPAVYSLVREREARNARV